MTAVPVTEWSFLFASDNAFQAPEVRGLAVSGRRPDGKRFRSTRIVKKVGPRLMQTESGSLYELVGDPDPECVAHCIEIGKPLDLADPLVLIRRGDR